MAEVNVALHMHYSEHADLDGDALLRARGEHDLQVDRSHEGVTAMEGQKVLKFVKLGEYYWVKWHAVAELVMPFVTIEATGIFAAKALSDAVLNRFLAALVEVKVFDGIQLSQNEWRVRAEILVAGAPQAVRDRLVLRDEDLIDTEVDVLLPMDAGPYSAAELARRENHNSMVTARAFLYSMQLQDMLTESGKGELIGRLYAILGSHIVVASRNGLQFHAAVTRLRIAVEQKMGVAAAALTDDDYVYGVVMFLKEWGSIPGVVQVRLAELPRPAITYALRVATLAWKAGGFGPAYVTGQLKEHFAEVLRGCKALRAMVCGSVLSNAGTETFAHELVTEVAQRIGLLPHGAVLNVPTLRNLETKMSHMADMLSVAPWGSREPRERADHVIVALRTSDQLQLQAGPPLLLGGGGRTLERRVQLCGYIRRGGRRREEAL